MSVTVSKWGNSLGIRTPRGVAQDAHVTEGTVVDVRVENGRIIAEPLAEASLEVLLARITPEHCHGLQFSDEPIGREAW
jgi:antitoxin MazE